MSTRARGAALRPTEPGAPEEAPYVLLAVGESVWLMLARTTLPVGAERGGGLVCARSMRPMTCDERQSTYFLLLRTALRASACSPGGRSPSRRAPARGPAIAAHSPCASSAAAPCWATMRAARCQQTRRSSQTQQGRLAERQLRARRVQAMDSGTRWPRRISSAAQTWHVRRVGLEMWCGRRTGSAKARRRNAAGFGV
jgi:hypothetical protein